LYFDHIRVPMQNCLPREEPESGGLEWPPNYRRAIEQMLEIEKCEVRFILASTNTYDVRVVGTVLRYDTLPDQDRVITDILSKVRMLSVPFVLDSATDLDLDAFVRAFEATRYLMSSPETIDTFCLEYWDQKMEKTTWAKGLRVTCKVLSRVMHIKHNPEIDKKLLVFRALSMMLLASPRDRPIQDMFPSQLRQPDCQAFSDFFSLCRLEATDRMAVRRFHAMCRLHCEACTLDGRRTLLHYYPRRVKHSEIPTMLEEAERIGRERVRPIEPVESLQASQVCDYPNNRIEEVVGEEERLENVEPNFHREGEPLYEAVRPLNYDGTRPPVAQYLEGIVREFPRSEKKMLHIVYEKKKIKHHCVYMEVGDQASCGYGDSLKQAQQQAALGILTKRLYGSIPPILYHHRCVRTRRDYEPQSNSFHPNEEGYEERQVLLLIDVRGRVAMMPNEAKRLDLPCRTKIPIHLDDGSGVPNWLCGLEIPWEALPVFKSRDRHSDGGYIKVFRWDCRRLERDPYQFSKYFSMVDLMKLTAYSLRIDTRVFRVIDHYHRRRSDYRHIEEMVSKDKEGPMRAFCGMVSFDSTHHMKVFFANWQEYGDKFSPYALDWNLVPKVIPF